MFRYFARSVVVLLLVFSIAPYADALAPIEVDANTGAIDVYSYGEVFEDKTGELSIEGVARDNIAFRKTSTSDSRDNIGFTRSAFWLRLRIINRSAEHNDWFFTISGSPSKSINAYARPEGRAEFLPLTIPITTRSANFRLPPKLNEPQWVYFRVHDLHTPLTFNIGLKNTDTLLAEVASQYPIYGILIGGLLSLAIYNLFYFLYLREAGFLAISIFVIAFTTELMSHMGWFRYFPDVSLALKFLGPFASLVTLSSAVYVLAEMLNLENHINAIYQSFRAIFWTSTGLAVLSPLIPAYGLGISAAMALVLCLMCVVLYISHFFKKITVQPVTLFGGLLFLASIFPSLLTAASIIDVPGWVTDGSSFVLLLSLILLSLDQAERTRQKSKQAERSLAASQAKDEFLTTMSHELRTPMNAVTGAGHLLNMTPLSYVQKEYVERLNSSSQHMLVLINDILDLAKLDHDGLVLEQYPFDLKQVISSLEHLLVDSCRSKGLSLVLDNQFLPLNKQLVGDPIRLKQVLLNLLHNGAKFTEHGEIKLLVTPVDIQSDSARLKFEVFDTGVGISAEQHGSLFNSFTQAESSTSRKYGGSGLGLAICDRLVKCMGGSISIQSTISEGSCFAFTLDFPLKLADKIVKKPIAPNYTKHDLDGLKVLLVDDDEMNRFFGEKLLESCGVTAFLADSGDNALTQINKQLFDVVLMDISMPDMDGYETTRKIREIAKFESMPVIALTAHAVPGERERCLSAGMNDYLTKPFELNDLKSLLGRWAVKNKHLRINGD